MNCTACGAGNPVGRKFCRQCGARLLLTCTACGAPAEPDDRFCGECGAPLGAAAGVAQAAAAPAAAPASAAPAPRFASPQAYTPTYLAERILTSRGALEGERKQVTVLFADLKGSMELLADRDPEDARRVLDPVLERMIDAVHRYEGTVNQVMGDGIMALFGAPVSHEDHAVRACYAALRMQESVRQYAWEARQATGVPIQIRVGLNCGEVVVRSIGNDLTMDYTAVGQTTHLAARMEQMATPGSILITPDVLRLVEGYVQVRSLGTLPVRGVADPIDVYEVAGAGLARTRLQAAAARGLTRFVGRVAEMEALRQALGRTGAGHGQVVALVGEPGVGKSRLAWEFSHSHRTEGWLVLESGSVSYGRATPYLPVADLLRAYFQIEARDDARRIREKVTGKVLTLDEQLRPILPPLLALLDVPVEDPAWGGLDPPQRRQRTLEAVKQLLLTESRLEPLVLVFEDLHWIDGETQAFLDSLLESLPAARILLLVNYRTEYQHSWASKTYYTQLRLDPLPPESAEELLGAILGPDPALANLKGLLFERTEGNPFFLEESVRTLVETGVLVGERGAHRLARPVEGTQVPATVQAMLAARIDRLAPEIKRLLQCAAVIGKDVPFPLLLAITELREDWLRQGLADLQDGEFLYETSLFPDLEYTFKHALTHEVAYAGLLGDRRRALHARIVDAIEQLYPDRLAEQVERLAHHAVRGEVWDRAVDYLQSAGARALERSAYREAAAHFEQALEALTHLPESRATVERGIDLRADLRNALYPLGEVDRLLGYLREGLAMAEQLGDQRRIGWLSVYMSSQAWFSGDYSRAHASGERALAIASDLGDFPLRIEAMYRSAIAHLTLGGFPQATALFQEIIQAVGGEREGERFGLLGYPAVLARHWLVDCLVEAGQFGEAIVEGDEGLRIAGAVAHPFSIVGMYFHVGLLYIRKGEHDRAIAALERGIAIGRERQVRLLVPVGSMALAGAYALAGRVGEALAVLEEAEREWVSMGAATFLHGWTGAIRAEAYLAARRVHDARESALQALIAAQSRGERGYEAWTLFLLGDVAAQSEPPDPEEAESSYGQALELATELGMRPLQARCHLGLGTLYQRAGRAEEAAAELSTARDMFQAMDMTFWLERAEAALA